MRTYAFSIHKIFLFVISVNFILVNVSALENKPVQTTVRQNTTRNNSKNSIRQFNADQIAIAETNMWKAYYSRDAKTLGKELVNALMEQFHLSPADALAVAADLTSATFAFQSANGNYEAYTLPGLKQAYARIKTSTG